MQNKTIGVFFGGMSPEHDVSIITGQLIISELKKQHYDVVPVYIGKGGEWFIGKNLGKLKFFKDENIEERLKNYSRYYLDLEKSKGKMILKNKKVFSKEIKIDIAFPAFHGKNGEDGTFQGVCDFLNMPYVGCDVPSSAITMDKVLTKLFYKSQNIPTTKFLYFSKNDWEEGKENCLSQVKEKLNWPLFIKPASLGSSIAMTKVKESSELENACDLAFHYDNKIIIEESVEDLIDITCALLGNENPKASLLQESLFESDHFSYEDKYLKDGGAQLGNAQENIIIPARLDKETIKKTRDLAVKIFQLLGCSGIARVDFLYDKSKKIMYANEVNALPGTLYHHLWKASGIELGEVVNSLVNFAIQKHEKNNKISSTFESALLDKARSIKLQLDKDKNNV